MSRFLDRLFGRMPTDWKRRASSIDLLLWGLRGVFGAVVSGMAINAFAFATRNFGDSPILPWLVLFGILGIGLLIVLIDVLVRNKQITTISAVYFGLLLGLLLGNIFYAGLEPFIFAPDPTGNDMHLHAQGTGLDDNGGLLLCDDLDVVADEG